MKDTPNRYIYRDIAGLSAKAALNLISSLERAYSDCFEFRNQLRSDREFFEEELRKENQKRNA